MNRARLLISACICVLVIAVIFALSVPRATEVPSVAKHALSNSRPRLEFSDSSRKGFHTITGTMTATNACASLDSSAALASTSAIRVDLTFVEEPGVCLIRSTALTFQTTVLAPQATELEVYVNGALASSTNL